MARGSLKVYGPANEPKKQYMVYEDNQDEWNPALDQEMAAAMLKNYCEHVPAKFLPDFYETIKTEFGNDYGKYIKFVYSQSKLLKKGQKFYQNEKTLKDPGVLLGISLLINYRAILADLSNKTEEIDAEEKKLCEAKVQMEMDLPHYSDANSTMRLSYGQVGGYMIGGFNSNYYTLKQTI